ncbi:MAG: tRNA (adenosine(37)-N6)-dimethylallyltransferase MiaA [Minisyncoccia bacterium]
MHKVIAIVGPTSSGKSALGVALAKAIGCLPEGRRGEIISADSRQVYRGLDIGTGKVSKREMQGVPHHMLSIVSPKKRFSAGEFAKRAEKKIFMIYHKNNIPIVVGGTGFYVDALLGPQLPDVSPNPALRKALAKKSAPELFAMLKKLDPARAATIDPHNPPRLARAIEIARALGHVPPLPTKSSSDYSSILPAGQSGRQNTKIQTLWLGIAVPQKILERKIHDRLLVRLKRGMIAEAKKLHVGGLSYKRMEELGLEYRFLACYLQGKISKQEMIGQLDRAIRNYAKRQMRYLGRNKNIIWIKNEREAITKVKNFLSKNYHIS